MGVSASQVEVDGAAIGYTDVGSGRPVVFVHGAYVTGALWDDVAHRLLTEHRCVAPTWPFGAQLQPVGCGVDLGVVASGRRIAGMLDALELSDVTLVANDTGGGIVLASLADSTLSWERVSRLVFTNCDSFQHFPPSAFAPIVRLCRLNATVGAAALRVLATPPGRAMFANAVTRKGIDKKRQGTIFGGFSVSADVRREAVRFTADLQPRYTMAAATAIEAWQKPVLVAWGSRDRMFPMTHARRLVEAFPHAKLRIIEDSSTYVMLDQPDQTASAIDKFING